MPSSHFKVWANRLVPALLFAALLACGGKKDGGATDAQLGADGVPKVTTAENGAGPGSKDAGAVNEKDVCDKQGDAYARFANYTYNTRDYVFKAANELGFHSLYQANPAQYTAKDVALMHTYFAQADKRVYGFLNVEIEKKMIQYQQAAKAGEWEKVQANYNGMQTMLQARYTLFGFYANIFGMTGGITWFDAKDLDGEIAEAMRPYRETVTASATLTEFQKAEIEYAMVESARYTVARIDNKDYVVATTFNASRRMVEVQLIPATAEAVLYVNHQKLQKSDYVIAEAMLKEYEVAMKDLEVKYTALKEKQAAMDPVEYQNQVTAMRHQYVEVTAAKYLIETMFRPEFSRVQRAAAAVSEYTARIEKIDKRIAELKAALEGGKLTAAESDAYKKELTELTQQREELARAEAATKASSGTAAEDANGATTEIFKIDRDSTKD